MEEGAHAHQRRIRVVDATSTISVLLAVAGSVVITVVAGFGALWSTFNLFMLLFAVFFGPLVAVVVRSQPQNPLVPIFAISTANAAIQILGRAVAMVLSDDPQLLAVGSPIPVELSPSVVAWINMVTAPLWIGVLVPLLTFGFLIFPDGRLPSRRWRWVVPAVAVTTVLLLVGDAWSYRPSSASPDEGLLLDVAIVAWLVLILVSITALVLRYRSSTGIVREQFKWIVWGGAILVAAQIAAIAFDSVNVDVSITVLLGGSIVFFVAYGIAMARHQLFDVDIVISRTVMVAGLIGFMTVVYGAVVVTVALVLGDLTGAAVPLSISATVVVAIAFEPFRQRMRRWANRLVYGDRATPYEVLAGFSAWMRDAVATDDVLPRVAELLAQGTGALLAVVWVTSGDELRAAAVWPETSEMPVGVIDPSGGIAVHAADRVGAIEHDGELLGAVSVQMPRGERLAPAGERLVDDVASQAGLVVRNAMLTADLVETIAQLRSSRQRLVAAQDEERRRLERDLHDGAQQQLVALKMKIGLTRRLIDGGDLERAGELLGRLSDETSDAVESLRTLAHGIYPPLLEAEGLESALVARMRNAPVDITVTAHGLRRYPPDVEAAIYFCVLEAVQNAVKSAQAESVAVTLRHVDDLLLFVVKDDGAGFDSETVTRGRGLTNMADRMDALGGTLEIRSSPGDGTIVEGALHGVSVIASKAEPAAT